MSIKNWPSNERPREKMLLHGSSVLSDAELLAIFLRTGVKGKTSVDLARQLLTHFGNLRTLLHADLKAFSTIQGVGSAKYIELQAVLELSRRYLFEAVQESEVLENSFKTRQYLMAKLGCYKQEVFACLLLDSKNRMIAFKELFTGSIDRADVYPREVVKAALAHNAVAIIFAHNHPSGDPQPSSSDIALTKQLQAALNLVDIRVLDHIVVGSYQAISFVEQGLLVDVV